MSSGHPYSGRKIHVGSGLNDGLSACGAPMHGQNGWAATRFFVNCRKCKRTSQYKQLPSRIK